MVTMTEQQASRLRKIRAAVEKVKAERKVAARRRIEDILWARCARTAK